ncbi:MAG: hypothetical protein ACRBBN_05030 [Methyloligellaceae bacterium]
MVDSIKGTRGISATSYPHETTSFSSSLDKAKQNSTAANTSATSSVSTKKSTALAGQIVHKLATGAYTQSDISSGKLKHDIENITGRSISTSGFPEHAIKVKTANSLVDYLKNTGN